VPATVVSGAVLIREATPDDWPAIWPFLHDIVAAGETYTWDRDISEERARDLWILAPPGRTVVAVDPDGTILGSAKMNPNHMGPASHVAGASFMVDPAHGGRGVGRALGEYVLDRARADGYRAMQFNAVVETNTRAVALWRSLGFEVLATLPEGFNHPTKGYVGLHIMYRRL
jgi:L-amino acid N-acyltransferase YncA